MKEILLKRWLMDLAERDRVPLSTIYGRYSRGRYSGLKLRRVNMRVVYVTNPDDPEARICSESKTPRRLPALPPGQIHFNQWAKREAAAQGISLSAVYNRRDRGGYIGQGIAPDARVVQVQL